MRWFVEVSKVGDSTLAERYCVEAKAWQAALQETRKLRGDSGPLSKFSIELLDDGYRAVDPVQKIRYLVNQAPSDAALVMPQVNGSYSPLSAPPAASSPPAGAVASVAPAAAALAAQAATVRPAPVAPIAPVAAVAPVVSVAPAGVSAAPVASSVSSAALAGVATSVAPGPASVKKVMGVTLGASISPSSPSASAAPVNSAVSGGAPRPSPRRSAAPKAAAKGAAESNKAAEALAPTPMAPAVTVVPGAVVPVAPVAAPVVPAAVAVAAPAVATAHAPAAVPAPTPAPAPVAAVPAPTPAPAPVAAVPAPTPAPAPVAAVPAAAPVQELSVPPVVKAPAEARAPGVPEFEVFASRVQEPSPEAPITYRELACVVHPGTPREAVEALLRDRLNAARADFSARVPGQLIQIAIFDHVFEDRPLRAPLGTLAWKDWRGDPILGFPAFGEAAPPTTPSLPPSPIVPVAGESAAAAAPAPSETVASAVTPVEAAPSAAAPSAATEPAAAAPAPAATATEAAASAEAESEEAQPVLLSRPVSRPDSDRVSSPRITLARRRAGEDLISELFESMHELHFARDIALGAEFVLNVVDQTIPCEATLIQVFDINTRNFVVVRGRGGEARRAVLNRTPDNDPLIAEVMRRERARAYRTEGDARFSSGRWTAVGLPLREVLCGAVRQGGRYLGMIELANPQGGAPFHETEVNALDYICEQFADFVASRPVVLDPDVILGR